MRAKSIFIKIFKYIRPLYICYAIVLILFMIAVSNIGNSSVDKQQESLESAIRRDMVHCYCVEGFYPPSLEYISEHYGLTYNEDLFFVDYQPIASNIMPDVVVLRKEG